MLEIGNKAQQENGYYAVKCLSLKAQAAYDKSGMVVYEYWPADVSHLRPFGPRYAIEWGDHFRYDLTEAKLESFLERAADEWTEAETLAANLCGIVYDGSGKGAPDFDMITQSIVQARQFDQKELYKLLKGIAKVRAGISFYYLTEQENINRIWHDGITDPDGVLLSDSKKDAEQYAAACQGERLAIIKIRIPPKDKTPIKVITLDGVPGLFHLYTGTIPPKYLEGYYTNYSGVWI